MAGSTAKAASKAPQPELGAASLGAPVGQPVDGFARGDSPLRARLAALEMELEALKRGSDGGASVAEGGQAADLAAALKEQTEALKEALSARGGSNSITTVKTDLVPARANRPHVAPRGRCHAATLRHVAGWVGAVRSLVESYAETQKQKKQKAHIWNVCLVKITRKGRIKY